jgi:hypothetical protein
LSAYKRIPGWLVPVFLLGATVALAGAYWDDATHTEKGRDSFLIPPHIAIYSGVMLAGAGIGTWVLLYVSRYGVRAMLKERALALAFAGVAVALAAAPIDNAWHLAFGRDAVLWSPPHVLGIVGTAAMALCVQVEMVHSPQRWARHLRPVAGGLVLAALAFLVVEYDTDVPQFPVVRYLPVLTLVSSLALTLVKLVDRRPFSASAAALVHLAFVGLVCLFLIVTGFDTPKAPLLIVPALVLDLAVNRSLARPLTALLYAGSLYAVCVPLLDLTGHGVRVGGADIGYGLPLAILAAAVVVFVVFPGPIRGGKQARRAILAAVVVLIWLGATGSALAHDPGQGEIAGRMDLTAYISGHQARVIARPRLGPPRAPIRPLRLTARRAGMVKTGPLRRRGPLLVGTVTLTEQGRWFVYVDVQRRGRTIESWLPVKVEEGQSRFSKPERFAYFAKHPPSSLIKWGTGVALYLFIVVFLVMVIRLARIDTETAEQRAST